MTLKKMKRSDQLMRISLFTERYGDCVYCFRLSVKTDGVIALKSNAMYIIGEHNFSNFLLTNFLEFP